MNKKTIFIIWKFDTDNINQNFGINIINAERFPYFEIMVENNSDKIICYSLNMNENENNFKQLINVVIERAKKFEGYERIILLHNKPPFPLTQEQELIIKKFGGGFNLHPTLYIPNGPLNDTGGFNSAAFTEGKLLKNDIFNNIWLQYASEEKQKHENVLINKEEVKKKIIDLWLPLAIDIQGLYETNGNRAYFEEVKQSLKAREKELRKDWELIGQYVNKFSDSRFDPIKFVTEFTSIDVNKAKECGYISEGNDNFFPKILNDLINKIDRR